ncbi:MAG: sugar-binding transcriptional regulator [Leptolinea sp.]|nr:sugar-binding transcriptional regulator [Leptolinea sp.]
MTVSSQSSSKYPNHQSSENELLVRIAWLYYMEELTQAEIAERLNMSRIKITRYLKQARDRGIVQISIQSNNSNLLELESALSNRYNLKDVKVVMSTEPRQSQQRLLAQGASEWLVPRLESGLTIGIGLSRTLSYMPEFFRPKRKIQCDFTDIIGGVSGPASAMISLNITNQMAEICGGRPFRLLAPSVVSSKQAYEIILSEPVLNEVFQKAHRCDILFQSCGGVDKDALLYENKSLESDTLKYLSDNGAVGDILGHFVDIDGNPVKVPYDELIISISLEALQKVHLGVLVAGGQEKVKTIHAALKARYFNVLITDERTATEVLKI